jgi:signal peptidase I
MQVAAGFLSLNDAQSRRPAKWLLVLAPAAFVILCITGAVATRLAEFQSFKIPSTAMEPTIRQGDDIVADMRYYHSRSPNRLDTIIFERDNIFYIKRVIAVGGDSIEGKNQAIYVNGKELDEPYVEHIGEAPEWANTFGLISVPQGKFFVMGDNRDYSLDSRSEEYGLVGEESIVGKPLYIFKSGRTGQSIH